MWRVIPAVASELPMFEDVAVELVADFVEVIHVELPHEGAKVFVSEIDRKDLLLKPFHVDNGEVCSILAPACDVRVCFALDKSRPTSRMSKVLEMKMEGPLAFSLRHRQLRRGSSV